MPYRVLLRLVVAAIAAACMVLIPAASAFAGDPNAGDVWIDNVGQPAGPGHENDPHLACQDINLWGNGLADSSGTYTIDGWSPSGSQEQDYGPSNWSYQQSTGGDQVLDVISVKTLIANAIANGDVPQANQGFHFKLQFSQDPQKHKTFWVNCQVPTITTNASSATIGQPIHDTAVLSGSNAASGTIIWNVYKSSDDKCSKSLGTVSAPVNGDGTYTSPDFTPSSLDTYQWVATYSGDAQNFSVSTKCDDPNEQSTVSQASPSIATNATSGTIGGSIQDTATLNGGYAPTGTITWNIYKSSDTWCSNSLGTVSASVNGNGTYTSPGFTPSTAGSYQWVAKYSGDANNAWAKTRCNDAHEQSTVSPASPTIATTATSATLGQSVYDVATLDGGDTPTGTISWNVYLAGTGCRTSLDTVTVLVSGDGVYTSPAYTPSATGTYQWVATYLGDDNNTPVATACDDPNEQSTVNAAPAPGISLIKLERDGSSGSFTHGPITGNPGDTIDYQMTVVNTGNTSLGITFSDPQCDPGTLSDPTVLSGSFDSASNNLSSGGELQYTCRHVLSAGDVPQFSNTASVVGQPPSGSPVRATDTVVTLLNTPGISNVLVPGINVVKLQRDGSSGAFTTGTITAKVGDTIQYEIEVTNTGTAPLALSLSDPRCNAGTISGPTAITGTLSGDLLSAGGEAKYTCSHALQASDASPFTNTATVTGQPPSGPSVSGTASVTANKAAVLPVKVLRCAKGKVKKTKKVHGKKVTVCVAKKKPVVISRKPIRASGFTG